MRQNLYIPIIIRAGFWMFLLATEILMRFAMDRTSQNDNYYVIAMIMVVLFFISSFCFGNTNLAAGMRDFYFYEIMVTAIGWVFYRNHISAQYFSAAMSALYVLKFSRLMWAMNFINGKAIDQWPIIGPFSYNQAKKEEINWRQPMSERNKKIYLFIIFVIFSNYVARLLGAKFYLAYAALVAVVFLLLYSQRFITFLQNQEEQNLANERAATEARITAEKNLELETTNRELTASQAQTAEKNAALEAVIAELATKNQELDAAYRERDAVAAEMAQRNDILRHANHDLRQPVWWARYCFEQWRDCTDAASKAALTNKLGAAIDGVGGAIAATIERAKFAAGANLGQVEKLDAAELANELEERYFRASSQKGIDYSARHANNLHLLAEHQILQRMLLNLVDNALHFTEQGIVAVSFRRVGEQCAVRVFDSGPGIAHMEKRDLLANFETLLVRVKREGSTAKHEGGHGIGLQSVKQLGIELGTTIGMRSLVGKGTMFQFYLPLAKN